MVRFQKLRRYREPVVYFGLSMLFLIWAGVGLEIRNQFAAIEIFKLRDASNYARVFEESVLRVTAHPFCVSLTRLEGIEWEALG